MVFHRDVAELPEERLYLTEHESEVEVSADSDEEADAPEYELEVSEPFVVRERKVNLLTAGIVDERSDENERHVADLYELEVAHLLFNDFLRFEFLVHVDIECLQSE